MELKRDFLESSCGLISLIQRANNLFAAGKILFPQGFFSANHMSYNNRIK